MSTLFNLLEKIKTKPGLYLGTASISNLRMFILGYRFSRSELGIANTETESDFYNFQPWLQNPLILMGKFPMIFYCPLTGLLKFYLLNKAQIE